MPHEINFRNISPKRVRAIEIELEKVERPLKIIKQKETKKPKKISKNKLIPSVPVVKPKECKKAGALEKTSFERLYSSINEEYKVSSCSVYRAKDMTEDFKKLYGDDIDSIELERYLSYSSTVILTNPNGIIDNRIYKCRYITRLYTQLGVYLICFSSYALEAFRASEADNLTERICDFFGNINLSEEQMEDI